MPSERVECRSDHAYLGYPIAFYWQEKRWMVNQILSEKQDPTGYSFRVYNDELGVFELNYDLKTDEWSVIHLSPKEQA
jgi:hypothetical protein